jgi:methionine sulfoxide reductase heme-binding subunit
MPSKKPETTWMLIAGVVLTLAVAGAVVALDPLSAFIEGVIRMAAVSGYLMVFIATLSSNYMRELTRFFGRAFVRVHHFASITALVALLLHASTVAWRAGSISVFVPLLSSAQAFFSQGGRAGLWLVLIAAAVALLRKKIGKQWKTIHRLNYLAFLLGTIHAQMLGRNFQHPAVRIVSAAMAAGVVVVFVLKRRSEVRRRQQRRARA